MITAAVPMATSVEQDMIMNNHANDERAHDHYHDKNSGGTWCCKIPDEYICPLTLDVMDEPLMTRWGHNFEREALLTWMEDNDRCPMTRNKITLADVFVNRALKSRIQVWKRAQNFVTSSSSEFCADDEDESYHLWGSSPTYGASSDRILRLTVSVGWLTDDSSTTGDAAPKYTEDQQQHLKISIITP